MLVLLCVTSMRTVSPTSDEQNHISRGYHYLVTGNLDLNVAPPLVNAISGIPLLLHRGIIIPKYDITHSKTYINQFAEEFVWVYNDATTVIMSGRLAIIALSVVLGYSVFRWAREQWGANAGLFALFLYVLDPNILAHSQLVTTDLGVAAVIFIATYFLWRFAVRRRNRDLVLAGLLLGLAQATKQSAMLLVPVFGLIVLVEAIIDPTLHGRWPWRVHLTPRWRQSTHFTLVVLAAIALTAFVGIWAAYRFESAPLTGIQGSHATIDRLVPIASLRTVLYRVADVARLPFPTYFRGLRWLQRYSQRGAPAFLMGRYASKGWWYYFLVAFAIKTPIPTLLLILLATWIGVRDWRRSKRSTYIVVVPVAAFFGATLLSVLNIGYRHILPVLPFIFVFVSRLANDSRRWVRIVLVACTVWYAVGAAVTYPAYLSYFNELVGGPENGFKYLVDSNLDWGQDLQALKTYMDANGIDEVRLAYFGSAHPEYYGIKALELPLQEPADLAQRPSEVYAISATYLQVGYLGDTSAFRWLRDREPDARVGHSIFLYRLPR